MKIAERMLENRIRGVATIHYIQFGFMPGKGTTHALFILRMQEEFRGREKKLYVCLVNLEKAFDRVKKKIMEWAFKKKSIGRSVGANSDKFM